MAFPTECKALGKNIPELIMKKAELVVQDVLKGVKHPSKHVLGSYALRVNLRYRCLYKEGWGDMEGDDA